MHCIIYIFKYYLWQMSILGSAWVLFTRVSFFLDHHHARRHQWRWARYVFLMIHCWLLTMTAQHRMTKAYPLACNCKPGWVSTFFLPTRTHPLACNCETGWVSCSFSLRQQMTTSHVGSSSSSASVCTHHDNDKPCRLVVVAPVPGCLACERGALYKCIIN